MHVQSSLPSLEETPKFLRAMRNVSATQCNCLPDCESTTFQYSVSTNNFMWGDFFYVLIIAYPNSFRECDSRNLNINPLCSLGGGPLPKLWLEGVINWASTERFLSPALLQLIDSDINFRALQYSAP